MQKVFSLTGVPSATYRLATTDTPTVLATNKIVASDGTKAVKALITVETNSVRVGFGGATLTQGASGVGHLLKVDDCITIENCTAISDFTYVSAANGVAGAIMVTLEF